MANAKVPHIIKIGSTKFGLLLPDIYTKIGVTVGIEKANTTNADTGVVTTQKADFPISVKELRKMGAILALNATTSTNKRHRVICSTAKVSSAITGLVGLTIAEPGSILDVVTGNEKAITAVSIPRKRSRY